MKHHLCRFAVQITNSSFGGERTPCGRVAPGLVMAAAIASTAYGLRALSLSGAVAATLIGVAVHTGMGSRGSISLVGYFATSTALGRLPQVGAPRQRRGNRRDAVQVVANGGSAALFAFLHASKTAGAEAGFYGSLAAAAADTWATEIGTRWGGQPRNVATFRRTEVGESGGVTLAGLAASLLASIAIASTAEVGQPLRKGWVFRCVTGGMVGTLIDSFLGALSQELRWCERCAMATEMHVHTCGQQTTYLSGVPGFDNDIVNFVASAAGGLAAAMLSVAQAKLTRRNASRVEYVTTLTSSRSPFHIGAS